MRTMTRMAGLVACVALGGTTWAACSGAGDTDGGSGASSQGGHGANHSQGGGGSLNLGGHEQGGGIQGCNPESFTLQKAPAAKVYLVIDRSGSMNEPGTNPAMTKWDELNDAVTTALTQYDGAIEFGLLLYPTGQECATSGPQVPPALDNLVPIIAALGEEPAGGTPTAAALNNAAASLATMGDAGTPKFVVLATDGGPNCNYGLSANPTCSCTHAAAAACCTNAPDPCYAGQYCLDDDHTLAVIAGLAAAGIDTFVIGLPGTAEYEGLLDEMAVAGQRPQPNADTSYYAASDPDELVAALEAIAVSVISCRITLQAAPDLPNGVLVYIDGHQVPRDTTHQNGWDYTDEAMTTIELYGQSCETLQDGGEHVVTATFACEVR